MQIGLRAALFFCGAPHCDLAIVSSSLLSVLGRCPQLVDHPIYLVWSCILAQDTRTEQAEATYLRLAFCVSQAPRSLDLLLSCIVAMDRKMFTTDFATAPSTRAHSMKLDSTSKYRPKPVLSLRSSTASLDQENIKPSNESSTHALSASSECPLRRTTEMPFPKPARSLSVSDGLVADRRTACEDDIALKLETVPGHSPKAIHAHQVRLLLLVCRALRAYKPCLCKNLNSDRGHHFPVSSLAFPQRR